MTREEFKAHMTDAADPNKAPIALAAIREGVEELFTTGETAAKTLADNEATINELRSVNMKLFLRQGAGTDTEQDEPQEETLDQYNDRIGKMIRGEE